MEIRQILLKIAYVLLAFLNGGYFIWGSVSLYIYSYFFLFKQNYYGLLNHAFVIQFLFKIIGSILIRSLFKKLGLILVVCVSLIAINILNFCSLSFENVYFFLAFFTVLPGIFYGFISELPIKFFAKQFSSTELETNTMKNICYLFNGLYPFLWSLAIWGLINPNNLPVNIQDEAFMLFDQSVNNSFKKTIYSLVSVNSFISCIIIFILLGLRNYIRHYEIKKPKFVKLNVDKEKEKSPISFFRTLLTPDFIQIFLMGVCSSPFFLYFLLFYKEIGLDEYNNDFFIMIAGSFSFLSFSLGNMFWEKLIKMNLNSIFLLTLQLIMQCLIGFLFKFAIEIRILFFLLLCVIFFNGAGQFLLYKNMIKVKFNGSAYKKELVILINFSYLVALIILMVFHIWFYEELGYINMVIFNTLFGFLTFIFYVKIY